MKIERFEDLDIWKISTELAREVYEITNISAFKNDYSLKDQIRRCVVSVSSNIAERFERNSNNEFIHFLSIAKGSTGEARTQLYIANSVGYLEKEKFDYLNGKLISLNNKIGGFIKYLRETRTSGNFLRK